MISSSPTSVLRNFHPERYFPRFPAGVQNRTSDHGKRVRLQDFLTKLPRVIRQEETSLNRKRDAVMALFNRLKLTDADVHRHAHFNTTRNYTRNLISTDHETYTLLLLCWNPNMASPIHDHPCDGCWMQTVSGQVQEKLYCKDPLTGFLTCTHDETFHEGQVAFIDDSMGLHSVGNPSASTPAITLHLYSPPFEKCKIWLDERHKPSTSLMCNYTEHGSKVTG